MAERNGSGAQGGDWVRRVVSFVVLFVVAIFVGVVCGLIFAAVSGGGGGNPGDGSGDPALEDAAAAVRGGATAENTGGESGGESSAEGSAGGAANPYAGFRVGEFELVDREGEPVDESVLEGEVTVLTFFFTSCNGPCPAIARVMKDIQERTADSDVGRRLRLASISVDGGRDTPAVIDSFAESYGADPDRWVFLTGDPEAVRELVRESIGFELREQEDVRVADPSGAMMNNILHPTRLLLVGPDRRLIGVYPFNDAEAVGELVEDAMGALE